jgi:hypothetical protein
MRVVGRDLIRGGHHGQRSYEPRQKAGHMAAPTNAAKREESSCQPGAVHTWRKAVVSQVNRKQLRWTVHLHLNRLPTAGRLWCAYVAPRVSVDCYRPIAAAGRRAGCAGS